MATAHSNTVICEICHKAPATRIISRIEDGIKHIVYQCDTCAKNIQHPPVPKRLCAKCKKREGHIKLTQLRSKSRIVTYICDFCATQK